ncbi:MAG: hypothetical protein ABI723_03790 [Bacteroidia bacterium]
MKTENLNIIKISKAATVVIFLALIRCISEVFRLQYYAEVDLTFIEIRPFLIGALISSIALLLMTLLSFWTKPRLSIIIAIATILLLLVTKYYA